ncbi:hypothetical protein RhiJN_26894 [Ceratobasidium sp. AG-Ba]|nr:hypothetical protein RhiJN_26894 [Ceratobasidium sp. AG-Ba]
MKEIPTAPIAFIGFKLATNIMEYYKYPLPPLKRFIQTLQKELHIPIVVVEMEDEDDDEDPTLFVCCYAETFGGAVDIVGLANVRAPDGFEKVERMVGADRGIRRLVCLSGRVYAVGIEEERAGWVWL